MAVKIFTLADVPVPVAGTRVQITSTNTPVSSVIFQAKPTNTGLIYIGDASVSSVRGITLNTSQTFAVTADMSGRSGGDEMVLSDWYVDAATNNDSVRVLYTKQR